MGKQLLLLHGEREVSCGRPAIRSLSTRLVAYCEQRAVVKRKRNTVGVASAKGRGAECAVWDKKGRGGFRRGRADGGYPRDYERFALTATCSRRAGRWPLRKRTWDLYFR